MASQRKVTELRERIERMNEQLEDLKEAYGLDSEDEEKGETVEVPAGGRTNWEQGVSQSFESDEKESKTMTEQVNVPAAGRSNYEQANGETIERDVSVDDSDIMEWEVTLNELEAKSEQERVNRRQEAYERVYGDGEREVDSESVPAGGRTNWEKRQEG